MWRSLSESGKLVPACLWRGKNSFFSIRSSRCFFIFYFPPNSLPFSTGDNLSPFHCPLFSVCLPREMFTTRETPFLILSWMPSRYLTGVSASIRSSRCLLNTRPISCVVQIGCRFFDDSTEFQLR